MVKQHISLCTGIVLLACLMIHGSAWGQRAAVAGGGEAEGSGGSASFSLGQVVYSTHSDNETSVAQGVQQPYEISVITGIEAPDDGSGPTLYPNPTNGDVRLQLSAPPSAGMHLRLTDGQGRLVHAARITHDVLDVPLHGHASGTYLLQVIQQDALIRTFRIVKH